MMPPLTKPTVITVVAEELWIIAVAAVPSSSAFTLLLVERSSARSSTPPDMLSSEVLIRCMPYKNSASPPNNDSKLKMVIALPLVSKNQTQRALELLSRSNAIIR
ncbi:hypothetical protein SDC9_192560 [bioreactor metagenome]|uniref:Uncharacterized protein n=1 Tax=bioreactor metagenome TaxID=1076179 RepID=A0A645IC36_9ZZZZ